MVGGRAGECALPGDSAFRRRGVARFPRFQRIEGNYPEDRRDYAAQVTEDYDAFRKK